MSEYFQAAELDLCSEVILFTLALIGVILNSIVLYIVQRRNERGADTILITMVGIFDLIACFFTCVVQLLRFKLGISIQDISIWCWFDLLIFSTSTFASLMITAHLSVVRYLVIVRKFVVSWKSSLIISMLQVIFLWIVLIFRGSSNTLSLMPSGFYCMPFTQHQDRIGLILLEFLYISLVLPLPFLIVMSYLLVTIHYHQLVKQGSATAAAQSTAGYSPSIMISVTKQFKKSHHKKTLQLMTIVIIYTIATLPEYTTTLMSLLSNVIRTSAIDKFNFITMFSLCLINPFFVLHLHENSRAEFVQLLAHIRFWN